MLLLAVLALHLQGPLPAAHGAFILRLGNDTTFVEQYSRSASRLEGDQISRVANRTTLRHFVATLDSAGNVMDYELAARPAADPGTAPQRAAVRFSGNAATLRWTIHDSTRTAQVAAPRGTFPYVGGSYALIELLTVRVHARDSAPAAFMVLPLAAGPPFAATVQRARGDSLVITFGEGGPVLARIDSEGRILGARGVETNEQIRVDRVDTVDIRALARRFATRPLGLLAPRDSVEATIGRAQVAVAYSRPSARGREIFGNIVPWNEVWRTGANAATTLRTTHDLMLGGTTLPAGTYTLWTIPNPRSWTLIINTKTGQWGTQYDPARDLARVEMKVALLAEPVEQFTIRIEPEQRRKAGPAAAWLRFAWQTTEASIPLTIR